MNVARGLALLALLAALAGLFVAYGGTAPDPSVHDYAGEQEVADAPDAHVGEPVTASGPVVETDPAVIEIDSDEGPSVRLTVRDAPPVEVGDHLTVHGTLEGPRELRADDGVVRQEWQFTYMYAVSALAALWLLWRAVVGWRFDRERLGFEPRDRPLVTVGGLAERAFGDGGEGDA